MANNNTDNRPLRLLCLDGGTPSGAFSQLSILNALLFKVVQTSPDEKSLDDPEIYPHTHFDMIAGTGLGGLLALMFGALQMSTLDAERQLEDLCDAVFTPEAAVPHDNENDTQLGGFFGRALNYFRQTPSTSSEVRAARAGDRERTFDLARLQDAVGQIVENAQVQVRTMESIEDPTRPDTCLAFVCVRNTFNMATCEHLRTYLTREHYPTHCSLVQAACATIATPGLFNSAVQIHHHSGSTSFVGAGVGTNNPARELLQEAERVYGANRQVAYLISIGAGVPLPISAIMRGDGSGGGRRMATDGVGGDDGVGGYGRVMLRVAADCEGVARTLKENLKDVGIYFRFSVDQRMGETTMTGWKTDGSASHVETYLRDKEDGLNVCADRMKKMDVTFGLRTLNKATAFRIVPRSPPPTSPYFSPRNGLLRRMESILISSEPTVNRKRIVVLSGRQGSGKTQIVSHFRRVHQHDFTHFIYINTSTEGHIRGDLQTAIRSLGAEYAQATWENALYSLERENGPFGTWCLIYDNVNVNVSLPSFIPNYTHNRGAIIVVSRDSGHAVLTSRDAHLVVEGMDDEEALTALFKAAHRDRFASDLDVAEGIDLLSEIGTLPLVVIQAGSYVFRMSSSEDGRLEHFGFRRYKELYVTGQLRWELLREGIPSSLEGYGDNFMTNLDTDI
ncbi:hypothetical protein FRC17_003869 [Serendipita sp. 399]|nr:hypothetical protein FRC17_003869 [Serendipita sp. 399]